MISRNTGDVFMRPPFKCPRRNVERGMRGRDDVRKE
jgi:hypothetical protein